jgi:hypothetical protein
MECSIRGSYDDVGVAASTSYNVVSGGLETIAGSCSPCYSHTLLPSNVIASRNIRLVFRLLFLVEGKLNVKLQSVPDALPNAYPFVRGMVVTRYTAAAIDPGGRTPNRWSSSGRGF